jgi:hypothetical protein
MKILHDTLGKVISFCLVSFKLEYSKKDSDKWEAKANYLKEKILYGIMVLNLVKMNFQKLTQR